MIMIVMFFAVFDSVRNFTYMPRVFGYTKELAIFVLLSLLFFQPISMPKFKNVSIFFYATFFSLILTLYFTVFSNDANVSAIIYSIKSLEFFLCLVIFWNTSRISDYSIDKLVGIYLRMCIVLFIVNVVGDYVPNPIVHSNISEYWGTNSYKGRFGIGQAPITLFPLLLFFIYQLTLGLKSKSDYILSFLCVLSIFLGIATTAIVIVVAVLLSFLLLSRIHSKYFSQGLKFSIICILLVFAIGFYAFEKLEELGINTNLMLTKIGSIVIGDLETDPSMMIRLNYKEQVMTTNLPLNEIAFGRSYNYYHRIYKGGIPIENSYANFYASAGVVGLFFFVSFIAKNSLKQLGVFLKNGSRYALFCLLLMMTFALYSYTLPITECYTMAIGFALFFVFAVKRKKESV